MKQNHRPQVLMDPGLVDFECRLSTPSIFSSEMKFLMEEQFQQKIILKGVQLGQEETVPAISLLLDCQKGFLLSQGLSVLAVP